MGASGSKSVVLDNTNSTDDSSQQSSSNDLMANAFGRKYPENSLLKDVFNDLDVQDDKLETTLLAVRSDILRDKINPHYYDTPPAGNKHAYDWNCSKCSAAIIGNSFGYDVEAHEYYTYKDENGRTIEDCDGASKLFKIDASDPKQAIMPQLRSNGRFTGGTFDCYDDYGADAMVSNPNKFTGNIDTNIKMITDFMSYHGNGAVAEFQVAWKNSAGGGGHSMCLVQRNGATYLLDGQDGGEMKVDSDAFRNRFKYNAIIGSMCVAKYSNQLRDGVTQETIDRILKVKK